MLNIMKDFYLVHSNLLALSIILLALIGFLISKKNYRLMIVSIVVFLAMNIFFYQNTKGKVWERQFFVSDDLSQTYPFWKHFHDEKDTLEFKDSIVVKFTPAATDGSWVYYDKNDPKRILHWCWVDEKWSAFANTDIVAWISGENKAKDMRKSSETRLNQ